MNPIYILRNILVHCSFVAGTWTVVFLWADAGVHHIRGPMGWPIHMISKIPYIRLGWMQEYITSVDHVHE